MITANEFILLEKNKSLDFLESEMKEFSKTAPKSMIKNTCWIQSPHGFETIVTDRFAAWFIPRSPDWKIIERK